MLKEFVELVTFEFIHYKKKKLIVPLIISKTKQHKRRIYYSKDEMKFEKIKYKIQLVYVIYLFDIH